MTSENNLYVEKNKAEVSKNVPELRFQGFIDAWEQRKLEELGNLNRGKSKHRPRNDSRLFGGEYPFIQTGDVAKAPLFLTEYSQTYSEFGIQQSKLWDIGTLLITIAANVADTTILGIKAAFPDSVIGFESTSCDVVFIKNYIDIKSDLLKRKAETSSQANLNLAKLKEMNLNVPKLKEQQKIGSFFKQLDDTIALHQRKLDKLKRLKQGYLQQLFPENNEKVPRVRFANFEDEWELRKLGELTTSFSGGTPSAGNSSYYKGDIPFIRSGEINSDKTELFLTEAGLKNSSAKMVSVGDVLYALYGATSGEVGISQINGAINQAILAIKPCDGYNSHFLMQWLKLQKQKIIDKYLQGGQGNLSGSIVKNLVLNVPNFEEQKKIGAFFKQLDDTITLHQSKLDKLNLLKQALLQKMFI
ncbi:restriction endonuclease subunit S [Lactococcus lactis]|uniref:restriction endonuclease subunit S n=1 Tax=Lactococcus lactis TaxID=1358 RepID=UPI003D2A8780